MSYKYAFLVNSAVLTDKAERLTSEDAGQATAVALGRIAGDITKAVRTMPDGGEWEIVSHHLLAHGPNLIVTFLVRCPESVAE